MKILVFSHTRCGSTQVCKWLSSELKIQLDEEPYDSNNFKNIFTKENIIKKIVVEEYFPTIEDIQSFDKVICLFRENTYDAAVSFLYAKENKKWHIEYEIDNNWIEKNKNKLYNFHFEFDILKKKLKNYKVFMLSYESIFVNKSSIEELLNYFEIKNPNYLDMLDYKKKYRKDTNKFHKLYGTKTKNII